MSIFNCYLIKVKNLSTRFFNINSLVLRVELLTTLYTMINEQFSAKNSVAANPESQRNPIITAWFSSFTPAWFFTRLQSTNTRVVTISRSVVIKDCSFNFL